MTTRVLPPAEWDRLNDTELAGFRATLSAAHDEVLVIEAEDGAILGAWTLRTLPHVEGLWIAPDLRGRIAVARRLWTGMRQLARFRGVQLVLTGVGSPMVDRMLKRVGAVKQPDQYLLDWTED